VEHLKQGDLFNVEAVAETLLLEAVEFEQVELRVGNLAHEGETVDDRCVLLAEPAEYVLEEDEDGVVRVVVAVFVFEGFGEFHV